MTVSGHKTHSMLSRYNIVSETDMRQALQRTGEYRKNALVEESKVGAMPARVQWLRGVDLNHRPLGYAI
jgi:hypothetical protein